MELLQDLEIGLRLRDEISGFSLQKGLLGLYCCLGAQVGAF